jgi:mono/diheme cytochrome c family protein
MQTERTLWSALAVAAVIGLGSNALSPALSPALGQPPPSVGRGKEIAERLCVGCHAINDKQGSTEQRADVPSFRAIAIRPYKTAEALQAAIMTPRHPMPAIPLELAEIRDVVAYIQSLK